MEQVSAVDEKVTETRKRYIEKELLELSREELIVKLVEIFLEASKLASALETLGYFASQAFIDRENGGFGPLLMALASKASWIGEKLAIDPDEYWEAKETLEEC